MPAETFAHIFVVASAGFFGVAVGSFLNVCVYRVPRDGLRVSRPSRSFCPLCGEPISWRDNLPVLSWIALGGRCRACAAPISSRYPLVELATAAVFCVLAERLFFQLGAGVPTCALAAVFVSALLVAALIDIELRILPDEITIGGMHLALLAVALVPEIRTLPGDELATNALLALADLSLASSLPPAWAVAAAFGAAVVAFAVGCVSYRAWRRWRLPEAPRRFRDISLAGWVAAWSCALVTTVLVRPEWALTPPVFAIGSSLLGMLAGSGLVFTVGVVGTRVFRKPAMGFGDVKLMGLLGAWTGWWGAVAGFFIACLLGSVFGIARLIFSRDRYLPFGPFLTIGALFVHFWPDLLSRAADAYLGLFR